MSDEIEQIKEKLDLAQVVGEYVQLKQMGLHFKGLCPFHQEKTPSFVVTPEKGIWHCFGCGEGGDAFSFVQRVEGVDFAAALHLLADRAGVTLRQSGGQGRVARDERQRLFDLLVLTGRFYQELLVRQAIGEQARHYLLKERKVTKESVEEFQLGYAPNAWDSLQKFLTQKGYRPDEMIAAGVVGTTGVGKLYDRFRGRIIFPIHDVQGRLVALAGRIAPWLMTGNEGKYVNSPETQLYRKRRVVYNLHRAKSAIRDAKQAIVVEGYMDVILLAQRGVRQAVASSGTAFTEDQINLLSRFTRTLHFAFDADAAGWKAAQQATSAARAAGLRVAVLQFPQGKDPADVAADTPEALADILKEPRSLVRVALDQLQQAGGADDTEARLREVLPLVRSVANPVQQGEMVQEIATQLHLSEERVAQLVGQAFREPEAARADDMDSIRLSPGLTLLGFLMAEPSVRAELFPQLSFDLFVDEESLELYKVLQGVAETRANFFTVSGSDLLGFLPPEQSALAATVLSMSQEQASTVAQRRDEGRAIFRWLTRQSLTRQRDQLQRHLADAAAPDRDAVLREFQLVVERLEKVKT